MSVSALRAGAGWPVYEDLFRHLEAGIAIYEAVDDGADFRFVAMNPAALRISRVTAEDVVGRLLSQTFTGAETMGITAALRRVHRGGRDESLPPLHYVDEQRDGWYRCDVHRLDGGQIAVMYVDVTDDVLAPREQQRRTLDAIHDIYRISQSTTDPKSLVTAAARIVAGAMQSRDRLYVSVEVDEHIAAAGEARPVDLRMVVPIHDGDTTRGRLSIGLSSAMPATEEEQRFTETAALALGLWARGERDRKSLATYEKIVSNTQDQLALLDADLRYLVVNHAYARRVGQCPADLVGRSIREVLGSRGFSTQQEAALRKTLNGTTVQYQEWRDTPDGKRYMNMLYSPYRHGEEIVGVIASIHDITDLHEAQAQLRRTAQVFSSSAEAVVMTEPDGTVTDVNEAFTVMFGFDAQDVVGRRFSPVDAEQHGADFQEALLASLTTQRRWRGEVLCGHRDGRTIPCLMTFCAVEGGQGNAAGYVSLFTDISAMKEKEHRLEMLAHHDPLTGLANRTQLGRHLERRVHRAEREGGAFTLMFIDLDHFKEVNDTLGHSAGDDLLRMVAKRLLGAVRVDDTLARIGGDEFVALLPGIDSAVNASVIAEKIISTISEPYRIRGEIVRIGASVGICCYPTDGRNAAELLRLADRAMYAAKDQGRAGWRSYADLASRGDGA